MALRIGAVGLAAALGTGGCGPAVDNPANPPRLGRWEHQSRLVALVANDVWIDRKDAPFTMPPDSKSVEACSEPTLKTRSALNRSLMANTESMCSLGALQQRGGLITASGTCGPTDKEGGTLTGTIEFNGQERETLAEAKVSVVILYKLPSGSTERLRAAYENVWRRVGDCTG